MPDTLPPPLPDKMPLPAPEIAAQKRPTKPPIDIMLSSVKPLVAAGAAGFWWDKQIKGFGLKVTPGGKAVYIYQYRLGGRNSPTRRLTIGEHGKITPDKARDEAKKAAALLVENKDPAAARRERREAETLHQFSERYVKLVSEPQKGERTLEEEERNLKLHILRALGSKLMMDIRPEDIERFKASMQTKPVGCNRCLALLSHMFQTAIKWGELEENPCRGIDRYPEESRERYLTPDELARLGKALEKAEKKEMESAVAAIRLLIFTGCRLSEILTLRWSYVDFDRRCLRLPKSKTGRKVVALGDPAIELLRALHREKDNPFVIWGAKERGYLRGIQRIWQRIRDDAKLHDVRIHDLRHAFASVAVAGGQSLYLVGKMLGHKRAGTTEKYAHLDLDPVREAANQTAKMIEAAMAGKKQPTREPQSAKVFAFPRKPNRKRR
jgi:integrase